ncbi:hypothetical protein CGLO_18190 [Colletotrichum gloeosporioides Cg-14]|uniref:Uncharacterized protein n=1 Tax=Colletotrichum gloeosporioides (strain Cg-14) TaxID=1237896 RepID=T0L4M4_COLGC|nr:hypothetical protein CGLO_18190 [Colletotrichum gloeosporioides Cg-14]
MLSIISIGTDPKLIAL